MKRRTRLARALESALLVGSAATSSGCCGLWFTRWVDAYHYRDMVRVDASKLPPELRGRYSPEPDLETCKSVCGDEADACTIATLELPTPEPQPHVRCDYQRGPSEWRSVPPSSIDHRVSKQHECQYMCRADGRDLKDCAITFDPEPKPETVAICQYFVAAHCTDHIPSGRTPEGLTGAARLTNAGEYFAEAAFLETASVQAFERLALELARNAAPRALVRRAEQAADDERRHARAFTSWSRRRGIAPRQPIALSDDRTSLVELALANAAEGCVNETYSALVTAYQARHAPARLGPALERIAREEATHAQLSWDIWRWCSRRLTSSERRRMQSALTTAVSRLAERLPSLPGELAHAVGMPALPVAREMFGQLSADLWEPAVLARSTLRAGRAARGSRAPRSGHRSAVPLDPARRRAGR